MPLEQVWTISSLWEAIFTYRLYSVNFPDEFARRIGPEGYVYCFWPSWPSGLNIYFELLAWKMTWMLEHEDMGHHRSFQVIWSQWFLHFVTRNKIYTTKRKWDLNGLILDIIC